MTERLLPTLPAAWRSIPVPVRRLMLGELFGLLAAAAMHLALAWWISREGGAEALARYGAITAFAALLVTPLLSPAGDRWPKRRLIRLGKLVLVLDALVITLLCAAGVYDLGLICACSLLSVAATALLWPAEASILPELLPAEELPAAIRLRRGAQALGGLLGPGLGGVVLAGAGLEAAMVLNLMLFVFAALAAWNVGSARRPAGAAPSRGWFDEMAAGLRAKWRVRLDRWWTLVGALMMMCLLPATGLLLPLRIQGLGLSAAWFGACSAAMSLGLLAGVAGLAPALIERAGRVRALALAVQACALAIAGIGLCRWAPGLVALFAVIGLGMSVTQLVGQTHRMLAMPEDYRARMSAAHLAIAHLAATLAPALGGALLGIAEVPAVYLLLAAGFAASGLLLMAVPGLALFLRQDHEGARGWYARHFPEAFTPGGCRPS
ncbi:MFS transporter [Rubrivivax gelatinosus]|uniref:Putative MFS family arabinose efflux permease n=1 Tax=Rubrivivax gelatinosus TaxID=28068 RepID=A0A4V2SHC8_RUBGE|nr:MFS transporter [Rubrivivax gelatinosus]MBK1690136.1 MFS transporter [Rubrivivax gelatinosus]TCP04568.1 putative MFS family arabinose efflux permease [Rubrivivax gelatinosus]